jgi:hypothetical protein
MNTKSTKAIALERTRKILDAILTNFPEMKTETTFQLMR